VVLVLPRVPRSSYKYVCVAVIIFTLSSLFLPEPPIVFFFLQVKMSSSVSSSDGSSGGAVEVSGGGRSISALFSSSALSSSSDARTSLGGVSTSAGSPILLTGSPEAEQSVAKAVEQVVALEESGDVISIDVRDEGEQANLPEVQGYEWGPSEPRTDAMRFRWGNDLGDLVERTKVFGDKVED